MTVQDIPLMSASRFLQESGVALNIIRLGFFFHWWSSGQIRQTQYHRFLACFVWETGNSTSSTSTNHCSHSCMSLGRMVYKLSIMDTEGTSRNKSKKSIWERKYKKIWHASLLVREGWGISCATLLFFDYVTPVHRSQSPYLGQTLEMCWPWQNLV